MMPSCMAPQKHFPPLPLHATLTNVAQAGDPQPLAKREGKVLAGHTCREERAMQKEAPGACRLIGFKDDPDHGRSGWFREDAVNNDIR